MIIPYHADVLIRKWPISNLVIIGVCIVVFLLLLVGGISEGVLEAMVLSGWNPIGIIGHEFLHGGLWHLVFNMLYLWVFGNAVCQTVGDIAHAILFLVTGALAGVMHILFDGAPAVGASGAINGIIGFYLVIYPVNKVSCFYWFFRPGTFEITGFWLILFWFVVDALYAFMGVHSGIAYWAHVGGFISGFVLGFIFLMMGMVRRANYDNPTLLDYLKGNYRKQQGLAFEKQSFIQTPRLRSELPVAGNPVKPLRSSPAPKPLHPLRPPAKAVEASTDINLDCPHCGQNLDVPQEVIGTTFQCPSCNGEIRLEAE